MNAEVCYVYLTDVADDGSIAECRWLKRGWTLQELIAPTSVNFYDEKWQFINDKISISSELASYTGIDESLLRCGHSPNPPLLKDHKMQAVTGKCSCGRPHSIDRLSQLQDYCVAQKMSWASSRETTRGEDIAYCLMGLFEVNMPLLYGEGRRKAFFRLQREIIENTHDQSILAIDSFPQGEPRRALASHPNQFPNSGVIHFRPSLTMVAEGDTFSPMATELTKFGVNVDLLIATESGTEDVWFGVLDFQMGQNPLGRPAIPLLPVTKLDDPTVACIRGEGLFEISPEHPHHARNLRVLTGSSDLDAFPDRKRCPGTFACALAVKLTFVQGGFSRRPSRGGGSRSSRYLTSQAATLIRRVSLPLSTASAIALVASHIQSSLRVEVVRFLANPATLDC